MLRLGLAESYSKRVNKALFIQGHGLTRRNQESRVKS